MVRIDQAADAIVSRLRGAGVPAAVDPRDLNPPTVWVQLDRVRFDRFSADAWSGDWVLWAIAPDAGTSAAFKTLGRLAELVKQVWPTTSDGTAGTVTLPAGGDPLPALRFSLALKATDDVDPDPDPDPVQLDMLDQLDPDTITQE